MTPVPKRVKPDVQARAPAGRIAFAKNRERPGQQKGGNAVEAEEPDVVNTGPRS